MLEWMLFRAIMVAFFILANSFFVAAEFALISVRVTRMEQLLALGRPGARTVLQLQAQRLGRESLLPFRCHNLAGSSHRR
jgi:CBS domain containing-hemolysin-like protein